MVYPSLKQHHGRAKPMLKVAAFAGVLAIVCILGVLISFCGHAVRFGPATRPAYPVAHESPFSEPLHKLNVRDDCSESSSFVEQATVDGVSSQSSGNTLDRNKARATGALAQDNSTEMPVGVSVPISTETALRTLYTIRTTEQEPMTTRTTTKATLVTVPYETPEVCSDIETTMTVTVTVEPAPPAYGSLGDATVTASPSTFTYVQTDVSYTSGLPDATVSGGPSTVTDVQTDTAFTSGLPDATVPGDPSTVTDIITTAVTPKKSPTVTITITDLWGPWTSDSMVTVTSVHTVFSTVSTIAVQPTVTVSGTADSSVLGGAHTTSPDTTYTEYVTVTGGQPATSTTTVALPPAYGGDPYETYGTGIPVNATNSPIYVPPVVSAADKGYNLANMYGTAAAIAAIAITVLVL